jgi:hypothetical protein
VSFMERRRVRCVRVYLDGSRHIDLMTPEEAQSETEYNRTARFGVAFFVDGECKQTGYLDMERCIAIGRELSSDTQR